MSNVVIPGQILVSAEDDEKSQWLRGHGTFVDTSNEQSKRWIASVAGRVERVNKLVSVIPYSVTNYQAHVGDLVVGRITEVMTGRSAWKVSLAGGLMASLPLSGVHLPGGVQRIKTTEDAREMRQILQEGDLVSAEVHKTTGQIQLHTRSVRYGLLENGCVLEVPPALIPRRKNHSTVVLDQFSVLWGCNGMIWMQRKWDEDKNEGLGGPELAEAHEKRRIDHAQMPLSMDQRQNLARLRNSMECLRQAGMMITPELTEAVYAASHKLSPSEMLHPDNLVRLVNSEDVQNRI